MHGILISVIVIADCQCFGTGHKPAPIEFFIRIIKYSNLDKHIPLSINSSSFRLYELNKPPGNPTAILLYHFSMKSSLTPFTISSSVISGGSLK